MNYLKDFRLWLDEARISPNDKDAVYALFKCVESGQNVGAYSLIPIGSDDWALQSETTPYLLFLGSDNGRYDLLGYIIDTFCDGKDIETWKSEPPQQTYSMDMDI
ncbi:MAG: hypothetical protein Q7P63_02085 [Verrucomicrobiota bacterium JB022]|nr:hypothetical protein [Verrucomicrobiota bacterium JB022]